MVFVRFNYFLKSRNVQKIVRKYMHNSIKLLNQDSSCDEKDKICCKNIIITGGTGSIGLATANHLLCAKAGKIAIIDTDPAEGCTAVQSLNCTHGKNKVVFLKGDVSKKMDIEDNIFICGINTEYFHTDALRKARGELKKVDMIINTFGIWNEALWEKEIAIGTININQIAKDIISKPAGLIINVTGIQGLIEPFSPSPVLAASFSGVIAYTLSMGHTNNSTHTRLRTVALCTGITESRFSKKVEDKICCVQMKSDVRKYMEDVCWQKPNAVAMAIGELINDGAPSGTVWVVEGSRLFSVQMPSAKCLMKLEHQLI